MKEEDIKIYCKFNENKPSIENVICKIFEEYVKNKKEIYALDKVKHLHLSN